MSKTLETHTFHPVAEPGWRIALTAYEPMCEGDPYNPDLPFWHREFSLMGWEAVPSLADGTLHLLPVWWDPGDGHAVNGDDADADAHTAWTVLAPGEEPDWADLDQEARHKYQRRESDRREVDPGSPWQVDQQWSTTDADPSSPWQVDQRAEVVR